MSTVHRITRGVLVALLAAGALAACGDDDEDAATTTSTTERTEAAAGDNSLDIEMVDFGYKVEGSLKAGLATINSTNTGQELHMAGFGKLKAGKTVEDVVKALQQQGGPPGGGEEGGEEQDPLAELIDEELGTPGHILLPGQTQSLTVDVFTPGNYAILCFIPTEGEGAPHFAKGMVAGLEVSEERSQAAAPKEDVAVSLPDGAEPAGIPAKLQAGKRTLKLTATGEQGKDFGVAQLNAGQDPTSFDRYFESEYEKEGGPSKGAAKKAPGTILGYTFEIKPNQAIWMTVDLKRGETFFLNSSNVEGDGEETVDKFAKVTVE